MSATNISHQQIRTACNRDCPDGCGVIATVQDGQVVRLQGDPQHPVTQGFLCRRTSRYLKRQYAGDRIVQAMVRRDKHRDDRWEPVELDEALDIVADRLLASREAHGPASILNYRCGGSMGMMKYVTDYFFQRFGPVTIKSGDVCAGAGDWAQEVDFGTQDSNDFLDLLNSKTIILWGKNVYTSHVHLLPILRKAKSQGARLLLIDPVRHRTAELCDHVFDVAPGGDAPLAFGIARYLAEHNRLDPESSRYCENRDDYLALVMSRTVEQWAEMAGVVPASVAQIAEAYANGPSTILVGWGMQRRPNGAAAIRAIDALGAISGNIGRPGASVSFYFPRRGAFDISFLDESTAPRAIPEPLLGQGIIESTAPPIETVFVSTANPVTNLPDSENVFRAMWDRFTVVVDMFMTDTADAADVFLPAASMLEDRDVIGAYGHHYLNALQPVVPPPGDARTDYQIIHELATRVGLGDEFPPAADDWIQRITGRLVEQGIDPQQLGQKPIRNPFSDTVAFRDRKFATPSGRARLIDSYEHPASPLSDDWPMRLMALSTDRAQASQWLAEEQQGLAAVTVHPTSSRGIADGQTAVLESQTGQLHVTVRHDETVRPDVALMDKGGWRKAGRCANQLIPARCSDHGECAVYYDTPVRLVPLQENQ